MVALLFSLLNLLIAPFKSTSRPEAERGHSEGNEFRVNSLEGYARCLVDQLQLIHFCGQKTDRNHLLLTLVLLPWSGRQDARAASNVIPVYPVATAQGGRGGSSGLFPDATLG